MSKQHKTPYEKLKDHLKETREFREIIEIFVKNTTLKENFSSIWRREDLVQVIQLTYSKSNMKNDKLSEQFICSGNKLCGEKKLVRALIAYNYAVLTASHSKENSNENDDKDMKVPPLVVAYATRSALLFDMKRYSECIRDIDRAIEHGYPPNKIDKLEQRRIKCLLKQNNKKAAEKHITYLIAKAKAENETSSLIYLERLLEQSKINNSSNLDTNKNVTIIDLFERGSEIPLFVKKYNKTKEINIIGENVKVSYMPSKGRHLVATRDIDPGEILLVERAFCSIPKLNDKLRSYCCVCLRKAPVVLPCNNCSLVSFCSDECLTSKRNNHKAECTMLPTLYHMKVDEELGLVFRTMLKFTMEEILAELEKEKNSKDPVLTGLKEAKAFLQSPVTYQTLTKLEGNLDKRNVDALLESAANAVLGVKLIQMVPQFWDRKNKSDPPIQQNFENITILGGELMKLLLNFQCNIHCIKELQINTEENILCSGSYDTGYGVYKLFSLMNHSCAPNALHSSWGDVKFLYSITYIPKGDEILDTYGERYVSHEVEKRKVSLKDVYYFDCECIACTNKWPRFEDLPKDYELVCPVCRKKVDKIALKCSSCKVLSSDNVNAEKLTNLKEIARDMKTALEIYNTCFQEINQYKTSFENIKKISNYIKLLAKNTKVPNMPIIETQELLLRSFDLMGAFSFQGFSHVE